MTKSVLNKLSEDLLLQVKLEKETGSLVQSLKDIEMNRLLSDMNTEKNRVAFWVNVYNAYYQILYYEKGFRNPKIYKAKEISIAGHVFTLDDIEHGILRRFRYKYSLGYFPQLWVNSTIRKLAVDAVDYRIHFALNCGATSCPAIAFYNAEQIDEQLNNAADLFIEEESTIDDAKKEVEISKLFYWFKGDFGGTSGIKGILKKYLGKDFSEYKLTYKSYDWSEKMKNFNDGSFR